MSTSKPCVLLASLYSSLRILFSFPILLFLFLPFFNSFYQLFLMYMRFDDPLPESIFEGTGVRNIFFRVENYRGAALEHLIAFIDEADAEIRRGGAVCAHCGGGKGRAGTLISCFMVRYGLGGISYKLLFILFFLSLSFLLFFFLMLFYKLALFFFLT